MKIRELHLKHFGQFDDKRIVLKDGINLFYGLNETGKSTTHGFIKSMLFGLEKGRGRIGMKDPFRLYEPWDQPNYYAGTMKFESGGKHFLLERSFDRYNKSSRLICEDDGEEFSLEQGDLEMLLGGLTAGGYDNTISIGQLKVETSDTLAGELKNHATNYYSTEHSEMDLNAAIQMLRDRGKELDRNIKLLQQDKVEQRQDMEQESTYIWREMHRLEQKIQSLEQKLQQKEAKLPKEKQQSSRGFFMRPAGIIATLAVFLFILLVVEHPWDYMTLIVLTLAEGTYVWNRVKDEELHKKQWEVSQENEVEFQKMHWQSERLEAEYKERQIQYQNLQEQLSEMEEKSQKQLDLEKQKAALLFAEQRLCQLAKEAQQDFGRILNAKASEILSEITGGKYQKLFVDEKLKMSLYTGERKIGVEQVSRGTLEQIYFALRMAASEILYEEELPVICDDTFVFYDDERLEATLRWLKKHRKQVLLFTCQKREGEILDRI